MVQTGLVPLYGTADGGTEGLGLESGAKGEVAKIQFFGSKYAKKFPLRRPSALQF